MIDRTRSENDIATALSRNPVVAIVGPRQCGKTTIARSFQRATESHWFDLEDPVDRALLAEPRTALTDLRGLIIIDEVQHAPHLFPVLRVLADRSEAPAKFLILGSASPDLVKGASESLAGRVETVQLSGFNVGEVGIDSWEPLWTRGGFPRSFLAANNDNSNAWRRNFVETFLTRDIPGLGLRVNIELLRRFWSMLAHYHGGVWNGSEIGGSLGISHTTVRTYLDLLTELYLVRQLRPWHENLQKQQVKSPKIYFRDSGLLHSTLGIRTPNDLHLHPKLGLSWEGFVIEQLLAICRPDEAYFWATQQGAELDLLMFRGSKRIGIEIKRADAPRLTPSMRIAMSDLKLDELHVIYPGERSYPLGENINVIPFENMEGLAS